jgi:hypothetical protein
MTPPPRPSGFTVRLPFRPSSQLRWEDLDEDQLVTMGSRVARLVQGPNDLVLIAEGIESEAHALELLDRLKGGLLWASLRLGCGILTDPTLQGVRTPIDPTLPETVMPAVDADAVGAAFVYPDDPAQTFWQMAVDVERKAVSVATFTQEVATGLRELPRASAMLADPRVELATQLYTDSFFEKAPPARFLTLAMVLEVLREPSQQPPAVQELLTAWQGQVAALAEAGQLGEAAAASLRGSLERLREESITSAIGALVGRYVGEEHIRLAKELYHYRSQLVHSGAAPNIWKHLLQLEGLIRPLLAKVIQQGLDTPARHP